MAYQWATANTMSVAVDVNTKADGTLATGSETAAGTKTFTLAGISSSATFPQAKTVLDAFIGDIASATYVESSAVQTIKRGVVEQA